MQSTLSDIITRNSCPACQQTEISQVLSAKDYTVSSEDFEVWECGDCGLRFTQNIPSESAIGRYYQAEEYISHTETKKGLVNRLYHMVRDYTLKQKRKMVIKLTGLKEGSLLDIGAGTGAFLHTMQEAGWKGTGLEPDEGARINASDHYGVILKPNEQLFSLPNEGFDLISMWHVLEHVHELHDYLDQIRKLIRNSGHLLIAVPNFESHDAETYGSHWAAYDVPRHLYHFSHASMEGLLARHQFKLEEIRPMPFDAFYVSLLSEQYKHGRQRLFAGFWTGFRSWLKSGSDAKRCSSILYIARPV